MLQMRDALHQGVQKTELFLEQRLPSFVQGPCSVASKYEVEAQSNYYLLHLHTQAHLTVLCQRCMETFVHPYEHTSTIAVTQHEQQAEELLTHYESIVGNQGIISLEDIITDELHLYAPRCHANVTDCDPHVSHILQNLE